MRWTDAYSWPCGSGRVATAGSREAGRAPKRSGGAQPQCFSLVRVAPASLL